MVVELKSILAGTAGPAKLAEAFAMLLLAGVLGFVVVGRLLRRRFAR
jgi:hypothetical protein